MKKTIFLIVISCLIFSCGNKKQSEGEVYALDNLLEVADGLVDRPVNVRGHVTHTCVHSGKRCFIVGENENITMRVEATGEIESFSKELVGAELQISGILREKRLTKEYIDQMEKETNDKMVAEDGSAESCQTELDNISRMREWMKAKDKNYYSVYYVDGEKYEVL